MPGKSQFAGFGLVGLRRIEGVRCAPVIVVAAMVGRKPKDQIAASAMSDLRAVLATWRSPKPVPDFQVAPWRNKTGARPIAVDIGYDVDPVSDFCGEDTSFQAIATPFRRGFGTADLATANQACQSKACQYKGCQSKAPATMFGLASVVAPSSWGLTVPKNPVSATMSENFHLTGRSRDGLTFAYLW